VRKLACTTKLGSYTGGSLASGSVTHVGEVLPEVPDKERHHGPPSRGLVVGLTSSSRKTPSPNPNKWEEEEKKYKEEKKKEKEKKEEEVEEEEKEEKMKKNKDEEEKKDEEKKKDEGRRRRI
jgi:cell division ATPase FtsA